jgi:hypothetical protein
MPTKITLLQTANILGFIAVIIINTLANTLPIAGKTTGELSAQYPNLFVPAGFTFSIWGLIYLLLLCFTFYQGRDLFRREKKSASLHEKIGICFFMTCLFNIGWIFAWHYELVLLSVIIMIFLLLTLMKIYLALDIRGSGFRCSPDHVRNYTTPEKLFVHIPFSIYFGWITIATAANITAFLVHSGWNRFGLSEPFWLLTLLAVCILIVIAVLFRRKDIYFALVGIWAFIGILASHLH